MLDYVTDAPHLFQFLIVRLKSVPVYRAVGVPRRFQFLIVRLKWEEGGLLGEREVVSIPYSTIKIKDSLIT